MIKRIVLFVLTNILVVLTISITLSIFGVNTYLTRSGIDMGALAIYALCYGFSGAFISLALSRIMAKWMAGVQIIDPRSPGEFSWLIQTVHDLARKAKLPRMPEVGVYNSAEVNAFATGPTKSRSLVAVSAGLLQYMNKEEIEGVLAHEIAHIQNGDMVTMTLLQGVVNAFAIFFSRIIAFAVSQFFNSKDEEVSYNSILFHLISAISEILLILLGSIVVCWFSRQREFRADAGSVKLTGGKREMKLALQALQRLHVRPDSDQPLLASMKISSGKRRELGVLNLFSTHPPLEERIEKLDLGI